MYINKSPPRPPVLLIIATAVILTCCTNVAPQPSAPQYAEYRETVIRGAEYLHWLRYRFTGGRALHVYIEGDGRPWITPLMKSRNPTPSNPLALNLMAQDPSSVLYLGRPCYFDTRDSACLDQPKWWTGSRYSSAIVDSMNAALDQYAEQFHSIALIGYSGGGTLAYLMASKRTDVAQLVTIAANLDTEAWAKRHGFSPLSDSLNPAASPPLADAIQQLHLLGEVDRQVPPGIFPGNIAEQASATLKVVKTFDHTCCWQSIWPEILTQLTP